MHTLRNTASFTRFAVISRTKHYIQLRRWNRYVGIGLKNGITVILILLIMALLIDIRVTGSNHKRSSAYVITLVEEDSRLPIVKSLFKKYANIELKAFYGVHGGVQFGKKKIHGLTPGQQGLRETMKLFFNMAIKEAYDEVFVFQDDAIPHVNFSQLFSDLPYRCQEAEVLLLGASMWHRHKSKWPKGVCFDADRLTFGAYGLLVKKVAFQSILDWLEKLPSITFDHIYKYLQKSGLLVRVAYPPFLVIMDVTHKSLINNHRASIQFDVKARARIHDWHLENYPTATILPEKS